MNVKDRIRTLAKSKGMSLPNLEAELGFGNGTIVKWDKSAPNVNKLIKVAEYLDVSLDYLVTGNDSLPIDTIAAHRRVDADGLTDDEVNDVNNYIEFIRQRRNK